MTAWQAIAEQAEFSRSRGAVLAVIARRDLTATVIAGRWLIDPADVNRYEVEHRNVARRTMRTRRPRRRVP